MNYRKVGPEAILVRLKVGSAAQVRWFGHVRKGGAGAERQGKESQSETGNDGKSEPEEERKDEW